LKLLAIGRPRPGIDAPGAIARHAHDELHGVWDLYRDGLVREMYSPGGPGVVLILEAASTAAAHELLSRLPLVVNEVIEFELIELRPFTAMQMLFSGEESA
jgi:hypothetical protein